ncbi:MAG TPA: MarR family transcriptional regulator [Desulfurococcales archaeon]|nr:MarR family transcriptional regulator [Desulfurococcales archaeon]
MPLRKPVIFISNIEWVKQVILAHLLVSYISGSRHLAYLVDVSNGLFRVDVLVNAAKRFNVDIEGFVRVVNSVKELPSSGEYGIFIYNASVNYDECSSIARSWRNLAKHLLILADKKPSILSRFRGIYATKIHIHRTSSSGRVFLLKSYEKEVQVIIDSNGVYDYKVELYGNLKLVYNAIKDAILEFGPLDIKDITPIIISKTGLNKSTVHKCIAELVRRGLIRLIGKTITLL